jgi:hypothetical protein
MTQKQESALRRGNKMNLSEKIELAETCFYFDARLSSGGNCVRRSYAPFDCPFCTSYRKRDAECRSVISQI